VFGAHAIEGAAIDEVFASMRAAWLGTGPRAAWEEDVADVVEAVRRTIR
jgi:hypothetical protein